MGGGVARESSSSSSRAKGNERIVARHASSSSSVSPRQHDGRTSSEPPSRTCTPDGSAASAERNVGWSRSRSSTPAPRQQRPPSTHVLSLGHQSSVTQRKPAAPAESSRTALCVSIVTSCCGVEATAPTVSESARNRAISVEIW